MSTTSTPSVPSIPSPPAGPPGEAAVPRWAVVSTRVGATATLLGSLAFISTVASTEGLSPRESFLLPVGVVGSAVASVGLAFLVVALAPVLTGVPAVVRGLVTAALAAALVVAWFDATAVVGIASATTDTTFDEIGATLGLTSLFLPKAVLGLVGWGALAVWGRRRRLLSRPVVGLLALGAVVSLLPPFPPALVLVSTALLLVTRPAR